MADKVGGKMPLEHELSRVAQSIPNILKQCYMAPSYVRLSY